MNLHIRGRLAVSDKYFCASPFPFSTYSLAGPSIQKQLLFIVTSRSAKLFRKIPADMNASLPTQAILFSEFLKRPPEDLADDTRDTLGGWGTGVPLYTDYLEGMQTARNTKGLSVLRRLENLEERIQKRDAHRKAGPVGQNATGNKNRSLPTMDTERSRKVRFELQGECKRASHKTRLKDNTGWEKSTHGQRGV
jgi:hypothetical protein